MFVAAVVVSPGAQNMGLRIIEPLLLISTFDLAAEMDRCRTNRNPESGHLDREFEAQFAQPGHTAAPFEWLPPEFGIEPWECLFRNALDSKNYLLAPRDTSAFS